MACYNQPSKRNRPQQHVHQKQQQPDVTQKPHSSNLRTSLYTAFLVLNSIPTTLDTYFQFWAPFWNPVSLFSYSEFCCLLQKEKKINKIYQNLYPQTFLSPSSKWPPFLLPHIPSLFWHLILSFSIPACLIITYTFHLPLWASCFSRRMQKLCSRWDLPVSPTSFLSTIALSLLVHQIFPSLPSSVTCFLAFFC